MELGLAGKTALVTGASKGIGHGVVAKLVAESCHVHMVSRSLENLETAAAGTAPTTAASRDRMALGGPTDAQVRNRLRAP
ncbi:MAG: SDR family NAD(P)-dependent oxidoreductase [Proteobacteria bacterium]|nr:SDR family NAD(P)-dependent oxidoreductase [Pseudomonadota bacterium]